MYEIFHFLRRLCYTLYYSSSMSSTKSQHIIIIILNNNVFEYCLIAIIVYLDVQKDSFSINLYIIYVRTHNSVHHTHGKNNSFLLFLLVCCWLLEGGWDVGAAVVLVLVHEVWTGPVRQTRLVAPVNALETCVLKYYRCTRVTMLRERYYVNDTGEQVHSRS